MKIRDSKLPRWAVSVAGDIAGEEAKEDSKNVI